VLLLEIYEGDFVDRIIKKEIVKIFNVKEEEICDLRRFPMGMSNYTYFFKIDNQAYVIRKIGDGAEKYVDYKNELNAMIAANTKDLTGEVVFFDVDSGLKVSKYLDGDKWTFYEKGFDITKLITSLKELHEIKTKDVKDYGLVDRINLYESYNRVELISAEYLEIKNWWINEYNKVFKNNPRYFCHNDLQVINIIKGTDKVRFIDFEYAGLNDIYYDIACFEDDAFYVLENYLNRKANKKDIFSIKFYQIYQAIQWHQVALYKMDIGFSENTNYDFKDLADYFITKARMLFNQLRGDEIED